jgi:hypothetical protein
MNFFYYTELYNITYVYTGCARHTGGPRGCKPLVLRTRFHLCLLEINLSRALVSVDA